MVRPLALTLGEPAGIGPDITIAAWRQRRELDLPPFYVIASRDFMAQRARHLGAAIEVTACEPREAGSIFATALPVVDVGVPVTAPPGHPDATSAPAAIASIDLAVRHVLRRPRRSHRDQSDRQERALPVRFLRAGPHRISGQARGARDRDRGAAGDDVVVAGARRGAGHHPPAAERGSRRARCRPHRRDRTHHRARSRRTVRHRPAAARHRRPQSPCGRRRRHGRGGHHDRAAGGGAAQGRGHRGARPAAGGHDVSRRRARKLRRGAVHVSRPGADPDQDARLRPRRQRDAGPAVRAHLARSRHRLRHRRHRPRRSGEPDRGDPPRGEARRARRPPPMPHERARRSAAAARRDQAARIVGKEVARTELPPRPESDGARRARGRPARRRHRGGDRSGPGRADPRAPRVGRAAGDRDRARQPRGGGARRDRSTLSRKAHGDPRRCARRRHRAPSRRRPGAHHRQSPLQHLDGAAGAVARHRAVAAMVRHDGADVPARGRRAHRRQARRTSRSVALPCWRDGVPRRRSCSTSHPRPSCRRPR